MSLGERLKAVRERSGLSQTEFAKRCGASKRAQIYFEQGTQVPGGGYLIALSAEFGVDVHWLLLGCPATLSAEEQQLIDVFRAATPGTQAQAFAVLRGSDVSGGRRYDNQFHGSVGSVVQGDQSITQPMTFNVVSEKKGRRD